MTSMIDSVSEAIIDVVSHTVTPSFRQLGEHEVFEKGPAELVTIADRTCEAALSVALRKIVIAPVLGEEDAASNPEVKTLLHGDGPIWVIDPIDGTNNFVAGSPDFGTMVAFCEDGETTMSWIWQPMHQTMFSAVLGEGAHMNGTAIEARIVQKDLAAISGMAKTRFLDAGPRSRLDASRDLFASVDEGSCAAIDYPRLALGTYDFLLYGRTLPWDHIPGVLLAQEVGCVATTFAGEPHHMSNESHGLLVAPRTAGTTITNTLVS